MGAGSEAGKKEGRKDSEGRKQSEKTGRAVDVNLGGKCGFRGRKKKGAID